MGNRRKRRSGGGGGNHQAAGRDRLELARAKYGLDDLLAPVKEAAGAAGDYAARGSGDGIFNLSQFEAANPSERRGWLYHPNTDTRKDLDAYSRMEMVKKSRWLQDNVGFAGRCVEGLADMIGYFMPAAGTADTEWNDEAEKYFLNRVLEPGVFDRAGKLDFADWQLAISRDCLGDGDNLTVLTESRGRDSQPGRAQVAYYESHQIASRTAQRGRGRSFTARSGKRPGRTEEIDGVVIDRKTGRRLGYQLTDDPGNTQANARTVRAQDVIFSANQKRHNRVRGLTALHRAVNHMQDATEITASVKGAIKAAADVVYQIITTDNKNQLPQHPIQGLHREIEVEPDGTIKADGEGTAEAQKVRIEDLMGNPLALQLDSRKLEMVHDSRPHPNQIDFLNQYLARDISWGVGVAPEILWMFNGESSPAVRFRMDEFRRWLSLKQRTTLRAVRRFWVYFWAKEFALGYPMPNDPRWWACDWVPLADLTIDHGRDGKLELSRYEVGADSMTNIYRRRGLSVDGAFQQRAQEIKLAEDTAERVLEDRSRWREVLPNTEAAANVQEDESKSGGGHRTPAER